MNKEDKRICSHIGHFYLTKHKEDYDAAQKEIENTGFVRVENVGETVLIEARRVGLLIGLRGTNVDALQAYLGKKIFIKECIDSVEDAILCPVYNKRDWDQYGPDSAYHKNESLREISDWTNDLIDEWEREDADTQPRRGC